MSSLVTVAIPVRDGGAALERTLAAVCTQRLPAGLELELVVCDSGSRDGSVAAARRFGAEVIEIPGSRFGHGRTRNLLMQRSAGEKVAFLTQDAVPAGAGWLQALLDGFSLAPDVALCFGPYLPPPGGDPILARELQAWFDGFSPAGEAVVDRLAPQERALPARALLGRRGFFTDANGALARAAWEQVPFRELPYAEDHALAHDMLRAGFAKAYVPQAGVLHCHSYSPLGWLRRSFDEGRALRDIYDWVEPSSPRALARQLWGLVGADWRFAPREQRGGWLLARSGVHHGARIAGSLMGGRAERLPPVLRGALSLERRA